MKYTKIIWGFVIGLMFVVPIIALVISQHNSPKPVISSPYIGQENRGIKALSQADIEGLLDGAGTPFGGMAKPGELNGYPGPRHVLDAYELGEFELEAKQHQLIQDLYEEMRKDAIELGEQIIRIEQEIDNAFKDKTINEAFLQDKVTASGNLYSNLRVVHLKYHLAMVDILSSVQVAEYNNLRGYTSSDPCSNIPPGHDLALWKLHNNCD